MLSRALVAVTVAIENGGPLSAEPDGADDGRHVGATIGRDGDLEPVEGHLVDVPGEDAVPPRVPGERRDGDEGRQIGPATMPDDEPAPGDRGPREQLDVERLECHDAVEPCRQGPLDVARAAEARCRAARIVSAPATIDDDDG